MSGVVGLLLVAALIAANGLFVAAEFALVSVRRPAVEDLARGGDRRAGLVVREQTDLSFALSSAQFGITTTSLLVGYLAERTIGDTLIRPVLAALGIPEGAALGVTVGGAFLVSILTQMLIGELFPKNLALARPLAVARAVIPATRAFGLLLGPVIRVFHRSAAALARLAFRVDADQGLVAGHSLDELARIIAVSGEEGSLTTDQTELLQRAVELGDTRVSEIMVPRPDVAWLTVDDTLATLRAAAQRTGHSRFPVRGDTEDDVVGTAHVKDLLTVDPERHADTSITAITTRMLAVPESEPLRRLLSDLRREQRTFALVVDEYGGTAGIVTLEDVLEVLVGDIEDEFDRDGHAMRRVGVGRHLVRGSLRIERLGEILGVGFPEGEYETVAGFVLDRLGHIPEPGEAVEHAGWELVVTRMEGVRVTELGVTHRPERVE